MANLAALGSNPVSTTGNVSAGYFIGNGSQLTGLAATYGNANVVANLAALGSNPVSSTGNITGGNILTGGLVSVTGNITGGNIITTGAGGAISGSGNITAGNFLTGGLFSATGNVRGGNLLTAGLISAAGTLTVNSGNAATAIINGAGNAQGNIGSASNYFNQLFAQATTALYADLAEVYAADAEYSPGTVVSFGGDQEVTRSVTEGDARVAGVISENPSYLMNSGLQAEHRAAVALTGRVPTLVIGPVRKGDMMISAGNGWARACATPAMGTVIGKALKTFDGDSGIIEIVAGRQ